MYTTNDSNKFTRFNVTTVSVWEYFALNLFNESLIEVGSSQNYARRLGGGL